MLRVFQLIIPTPYKVGPVNVYLIKNHPYTLVDAGANFPEAVEKLQSMLLSLGVEIEQIERVVLTHSHLDHSGLAARIAGASGAIVWAHYLEIEKLTRRENIFRERMPFIIETGIPGKFLQVIGGERDRLPRSSMEGVKIQEVHGGETLEFDGGELDIMHLPGHSPGHICLYDRNQKMFFSGDFILPHITPNPLMEPDPERPGKRLPVLKQYLRGLEKVEKMDIATVFPGHGGCFTDCSSVVATAMKHHGRQVELILEKLENREMSTFELCCSIYPHLEGWDVFLGLSEIQAHLDLMEERKQIACTKRNGVVYYYTSVS